MITALAWSLAKSLTGAGLFQLVLQQAINMAAARMVCQGENVAGKYCV